MIGLLAATAVLAMGDQPPCGTPPIRVTVVVVVATTNNKVVDAKLTNLAREVQKRNSKLTGFRLVASEGKSIPVGGSSEYELVEGKTLVVKVEKPKDQNGRVGLTVKSSGLGSVSYTCCCDKFFPVVMPHKTRAGETVIVAVMAKPCNQKK